MKAESASGTPASPAGPVAPALARSAGDRSVAVWLAVAGLAAGAWVLILVQAGGGRMAAGGVAALPFLASWVLMMAAMMFPAVAPAATLWMRAIAGRSAAAAAWARIGTFLAGYLVAWTGYGLITFEAGRWLSRAVAAAGPSAGTWIGSAIFAAAGIYQLTPAKDGCLRRCRSPIGQVLRWAGHRGVAADFRAGLSNGGWCVACCWGIMAVLLVTGAMNLAAMLGLAAAVFAEKVSRQGRLAAYLIGVALLCLAVLVPLAPWLAPGLEALPGGSM